MRALSQKIGCIGGFVIGVLLTFSFMFILIGALNSYDSGTPSIQAPASAAVTNGGRVAVAATVATATSTPAGLDYDTVCEVDESNMTDPQLEMHVADYEGRTFSDWQGQVYDVVSRSDDTYDLEIAMSDRGFLWHRDIVIEDIPQELAFRLNVEQPVTFSGRIAQIDTAFGTMCNPLYVDEYTLTD